MKSHELLEVIGDAQDSYVLDAKDPKKKTITAVWVRWAAMAACFALILGLGIGSFNFLGGHNGKLPGEVSQPTLQQDTEKSNPNNDSVTDRPIIWCNTNSGVEDSGFVEWNGKTITLSLYDALSNEKNRRFYN